MVKITLPLPPKELSQNSRAHWRVRSTATKEYRAVAKYLTWLATDGQPQWSKAKSRLTFYFPDNRRRDIRNYEAMMKPAYDGIVDAGLIADDSSNVLTHEATQTHIDKMSPRVEIELWQVE